MEGPSIINQNLMEGDRPKEEGLRPSLLEDFCGQEKIKENLNLMLKSSQIRGRPMDHSLFSGPPGLGKTSLAMIISKVVGANFHIISGPAIEKKGDLASILTSLERGDVLFIDEIHRIPISVEEILYSAMEDFRLDILLGQGPSARTMTIHIEPFTLLGATTRPGQLSGPLRDRFLAHFHFDFYTKDELIEILTNNSKKLGLGISREGMEILAESSRGTPRIANRILRRVRDFAVVKGIEMVEVEEINESLNLMEIHGPGLTRMDRKILTVINDFYGGGPVGIEALCATLSEDRGTLEEVYEPFLLKEGWIVRTPRGRMISEKAKLYLEEVNLSS
jgi:Holliday junction DNA helicase RuvB